ncbi:hypothetical protein [Streptobacillus canis]|uniref:hypothetical protein n=1 Tax=Streptobacillus canis TaxID=2678686 RepID=UPI0012E2B895|nr:hypothetical protein [Streptobacillus canis]
MKTLKLKNKEGKLVTIEMDSITDFVPFIKKGFIVWNMTIFYDNKSDFFYGYSNENLKDIFIELVKKFKKESER